MEGYSDAAAEEEEQEEEKQEEEEAAEGLLAVGAVEEIDLQERQRLLVRRFLVHWRRFLVQRWHVILRSIHNNNMVPLLEVAEVLSKRLVVGVLGVLGGLLSSRHQKI